MAGSFGYEAEHYETSIAMAELSLLPAVRKADPDALIVADGTSCRHQIADGSQPTGGTRRRGAGAGARLARYCRAQKSFMFLSPFGERLCEGGQLALQ